MLFLLNISFPKKTDIETFWSISLTINLKRKFLYNSKLFRPLWQLLHSLRTNFKRNFLNAQFLLPFRQYSMKERLTWRWSSLESKSTYINFKTVKISMYHYIGTNSEGQVHNRNQKRHYQCLYVSCQQCVFWWTLWYWIPSPLYDQGAGGLYQ